MRAPLLFQRHVYGARYGRCRQTDGRQAAGGRGGALEGLSKTFQRERERALMDADTSVVTAGGGGAGGGGRGQGGVHGDGKIKSNNKKRH